MTTRGRVGRDVDQYGPDLRLIYNFNKRLDLGLTGAYSSQRYEGGLKRNSGRFYLEGSHQFSSRLSLTAGAGMENLSYTRADSSSTRRTSFYYDFALEFSRIPRTTLMFDYRRRVMADINATVWQIDEVGFSASHSLSRRFSLTSGIFARQLEMITTELVIERLVSDWMGGVDFEAQFNINPEIQPVVKVDYVFNRGKISENDFANLRISTGFRYYFFSLN
jgi:hypothetical protein